MKRRRQSFELQADLSQLGVLWKQIEVLYSELEIRKTHICKKTEVHVKYNEIELQQYLLLCQKKGIVIQLLLLLLLPLKPLLLLFLQVLVVVEKRPSSTVTQSHHIC